MKDCVATALFGEPWRGVFSAQQPAGLVMSRTILSRTSAALVTLLVSSVVVFLLIQAVPGDIVAQMLGQVGDRPEAEQALRSFLASTSRSTCAT